MLFLAPESDQRRPIAWKPVNEQAHEGAVPGTLDVVLTVGSVTESITVSGKGPHAAPTSEPRRIRVGGNVQAAKLLQQKKPIYPASAESVGIAGTVLLRAVISVDGGIMGLTLLSSPNPALADAAMDAARQWADE